MNYKLPILFFFYLFFFASQKLFAQEEIYEPVQITDTLQHSTSSAKAEKTIPRKEDPKSEIQKKKERLQRLRFGGTIGFQFGTFTYINISPTVGYMVIPKRLEIGGGPIFIYERYKFSSVDKISFFVYGPDIYTRGYLYKGLYLEARYDVVNKTSYYDLSRKLWVHHLLLGAGYAAPIGKVGFFNISMLFNVLNNKESIYKGTFGNFPLLLVLGFGFGIGGKN